MATLTVGYNKAYSTISAAITAADPGDTVEIYYPGIGSRCYQELINYNKTITVVGIDNGILVRGQMSYGAVDSQIKISNLYIRDTGEVALGDIGSTIIWYDRCNILQYRRFRNANSNNTGCLRITNSYFEFDSSLGFWLDANATFEYQFYNSVFFSNTGVLFNFRAVSAGGADVANCLIYYTGSNSGTGGSGGISYKYDYCIFPTENTSYSPGENNYVRDISSVGFASQLLGGGSSFSGRIVGEDEIAGTTISPNGVDLTELYTTDIDGRTRTQYSIGCSEGYRLWPGAEYVTEAGGGDYHETTEDEVRVGITFGDEESLTGNYDPDFPDQENVLIDDTTNHLPGLYEPCPETGPDGVQYGANGTEYTLNVASGSIPTAPTLTLTDNADGTGGVATLSGSEAGVTNTIYYAPLGSSNWTSAGSISGDGNISIDSGTGSYWAYVASVLGTSTGVGVPVGQVFTDGTAIETNATLRNLPRWIMASISDHFNRRRGDLPMYIEGQRRRTNDLQEFIELRMDGPYRIQQSKHEYEFYIEINVLASTDQTNNYHKIHENVGIISAAFTDISVYKYGNGIYDTGQYVGCLGLIQTNKGRDRVEISHFGIIEQDQPVMQASVEGHYKFTVRVD